SATVRSGSHADSSQDRTSSARPSVNTIRTTSLGSTSVVVPRASLPAPPTSTTPKTLTARALSVTDDSASDFARLHRTECFVHVGEINTATDQLVELQLTRPVPIEEPRNISLDIAGSIPAAGEGFSRQNQAERC